MSIARSLAALERWLYATLTADASLTAITGGQVYFDSVPDTATVPYVYITNSDMRDLKGTGPNIYATRAHYAVRCVAETPPGGLTTALINAAERIHTVLHAGSGSNADGSTIACVREQPFSMTERDPATGRPYRHLGGIYRIWVQ